MTTVKLGRKAEHRDRTLRNLITSVLLFEKVRTTEAKAKAIAPIVERLISQASTGTLAARRAVKAVVFDQNAVSKLFEDLSLRKGTRTSGFVRITKLPARPGDGAAMAMLELLYIPLEEVMQEKTGTKISVRKKASSKEPTSEKTEEAEVVEEEK